MAKDRHREGYYKDWAKTEKGKAKSRRQTAKVAAEREAKRSGFVCSICREPRQKRSLIGDRLGIHQTCNPTAWIAEYRRLKQKNK